MKTLEVMPICIPDGGHCDVDTCSGATLWILTGKLFSPCVHAMCSFACYLLSRPLICTSTSPAGRMVQDTLTVRGIEVAPLMTQPTHIDIHIHQESALALLLKAGGSLVERLSHRPPKASTSYGQLTLGVRVGWLERQVSEVTQGRVARLQKEARKGRGWNPDENSLWVSCLVWEKEGLGRFAAEIWMKGMMGF